MKNWEEAYNNFDEKRYEELKQKIVDMKYTKEEMKEFKKSNKIHDNLPKVKNLMDYKKKLQGKLKDLKDLKAAYEDKEKYEETKNKLEKEMEKYSKRQQEIAKRQKDIGAKLVDEKLSDVDKTKLQEEQNKLNSEFVELRNKVDVNNKYFAQNEEGFKIDSDLKKKVNVKQLDKQIYSISAKISKCNFIAGKLMEGYDLESDFIKEKLTKQWKDRKFTSKEPIPGTKASEKEGKKEFEPIWSDSKLKKAAEKEAAEKEAAEKEAEAEAEEEKTGVPAKKESFEEAFPRLSKIMPKFIKESKLGKAMVNLKQKRELKKHEESKKPEKRKEEPEEKNPEKDEFRDSLKVDYDELLEIANKVEETVHREKLDKLKEDATKREEANKGKTQKQKLDETEASVDREAYIKKLGEDVR